MYSEDIQQQQSIVPQLEVNKIPEVEKSSDQLETHSNQNQHGKRTWSKSIFYNKENVPKKFASWNRNQDYYSSSPNIFLYRNF